MAKHRYDRNRPNAHQRGYSTKWDNARRVFVRGKLCCCGCGQPATDVDHDPPHGGDKRKFWDKRTWRPMAHECHSAKTLSERLGKPIKRRIRIDPKTGLPLDEQEHDWSE